MYDFWVHIAMTVAAFVGSPCSGRQALSTEINNTLTDVNQDTDKYHAAWHAMQAKEGSSPEEAKALWLQWVRNNMQNATANCDTRSLGSALHAVQDSFASGHAGFQQWAGGIPTIGHLIGDLAPTPDQWNQAVAASKALVAKFEQACCCKKNNPPPAAPKPRKIVGGGGRRP